MRATRIGRAVGTLAWVSALVLGVAPLVAAGCGSPRYPSCDNDEQCNSDVHKGVCVNHLCTECRATAGCPTGQECLEGACKAHEGYCDDTTPCAGGADCKENQCQKASKIAAAPVECDDQHPCGSKGRCENGHCVAPPHGGPGCQDFPAPKFEYESPELRADAKQVLERLAGCLSTGSLKGARVLLTGHCDARGEYEFNMSLGAQRAESVKGFLVTLGLGGDKIVTSSRGKLDATGSDESSWANDRRVDIEVR
jgi:outer membrane protein OmpA-like peptidoglycan-associated protein